MPKIRIDDNIIRISLLVVLLFVLYTFILAPIGFLQPLRFSLNDGILDILKSIKEAPHAVEEIVVIKIDENTMSEIEKKWPWDRTSFAATIEKIASYGPKIIALDITFFGASTNPDEDNILAETIRKFGNVILASYISDKGEYTPPYRLFSDSALGYGFVNKFTDPDYKVRRARLLFRDPQSLKTYFSFEIILLGAYLDVPLEEINYKENEIRLGSKYSVPVEEKGTLFIDYKPAREIANVPLIDILEDKITSKDIFKNKIAILGTASKVLHDIYQTPEGIMPGVFINTLTFNTIITRTFINDLPVVAEVFIILFVVLVIAILTYRLSFTGGILFFLALNAMIFILFFLVFSFHLKLDYFSVLFLLLLSYAVANGYKYGYLIYFNNKLKSMVIRDSLTGLATARYFHFKLQLDLSKAAEAKEDISISIFTVPEFQELLKKYNRDQIELILRQFSIILKQNSRKKVDLLSRWKEDKFAAILLKTNSKDAETYAQKIISKIGENEFLLTDRTIRLSVYAGISNYPTVKTQSASSLIACAEAASNRTHSSSQKICIFDSQKDKVHVETLQRKFTISEEDYLTIDIAEREKELLSTLDELRKSQQEIQKAHFETILSLVKALEEKDPYTAGHSERVADYAVGIAKQMGIEEPELTLIRQSALLHDVGKFGLPDRILHKKEALTEEEVQQIKNHPVMGARILERSKFFENHIPLILHHHERFDGKGYPHGLSGKFIPRGAQIMAIADTIDAMTTGRGYNKVMNIEETIQELKKSSGTQFDSEYINSAVNYLIGNK